MAKSQLFRWLLVAVFLSMISISVYFRYRARQAGKVILRAREGKLVMVTRLLLAALLYLPIIAYMLNPDWMTWASLPLPTWLRWLGAVVGFATLPLLYWVFSSIGRNVSETTLTKEEHQLVTYGPYRWVRHPLYSAATIGLLSVGLLAANWFILAMVCSAFFGIAVFVIPKEEAELARKFEVAYQEYRQNTGRLAPRLFRRNGKHGH